MTRAVRLPLAVLLLGALAIASVTASSGASFSARTANPNTKFTTAASFCAGSTVTLSANRDAYVDQQSANTNANGAELRVQGRNNQNQRTYLAFDLPAPSAGCSVASATLTLARTGGADGRVIQARRLGAASAWSESGVTWNNRPAAENAGVVSATAGGAATTFTVTSLVQAMLASGNPDNGFELRDSLETGTANSQFQTYSSRTGATAPTLTLTFG